MRSFPLRLCALLTAFLVTPGALGPSLRPTLEISCRPLDEQDGRKTPFGDVCARGEQLFLGIDTTSNHRYFAAFVVSTIDAATWFFPRDERDESVDAQPELGFHWIATETPVDELAGDGEHKVVAFFSRQPLDREAIRDLMRHREAPGVIVVEKKLLLVEG